MKIAGLDCLNRYLLAPMCGVTHWPYRALCREQGAGLLMTEMISSTELAHARKRSLKLMEFEAAESPIGVQISGNPDIEAMVGAAKLVEDHGASLLNLNCGCPVKKIIQGGSGSALLRDLDLLRQICRKLRSVVSIPLTIKVRAGWDEASVNALEVGRLAEEEGLDAIMIHPRTRAQGYEGNANWDLIRSLKEALRIPVIGNGDIFCPEDAARMLEHTGCDGVMIGRAAMGDPWIFRGLHQWEQGLHGDQWKASLPELRATIYRHLDRQIEWEGEHLACLKMRKQLLWYTHGRPGVKTLRQQLGQMNTRADIEAAMEAWFALQPEKNTPTNDNRAVFKPACKTRQAA
jgi:nifR3 family TIM-barrel protein